MALSYLIKPLGLWGKFRTPSQMDYADTSRDRRSSDVVQHNAATKLSIFMPWITDTCTLCTITQVKLRTNVAKSIKRRWIGLPTVYHYGVTWKLRPPPPQFNNSTILYQNAWLGWQEKYHPRHFTRQYLWGASNIDRWLSFSTTAFSLLSVWSSGQITSDLRCINWFQNI